MKNNVDYLKIIGKLEKLLYARTNVLVRNLKILTCPLAACHVFEKGGIVCLKKSVIFFSGNFFFPDFKPGNDIFENIFV